MKKSTSTKPVKKSNYYDTKSFSFFIPASAPRKTGHREKEFDHLLYQVLSLGHEIIDLKMSSSQAGTLVVCLLGSIHKKAIGSLLDIQDSHGLDSKKRDFEIEMLHED